MLTLERRPLVLPDRVLSMLCASWAKAGAGAGWDGAAAAPLAPALADAWDALDALDAPVTPEAFTDPAEPR